MVNTTKISSLQFCSALSFQCQECTWVPIVWTKFSMGYRWVSKCAYCSQYNLNTLSSNSCSIFQVKGDGNCWLCCSMEYRLFLMLSTIIMKSLRFGSIISLWSARKRSMRKVWTFWCSRLTVCWSILLRVSGMPITSWLLINMGGIIYQGTGG